MSKPVFRIAAALSAFAAASGFAQTDVGVSISINKPGVYGRINIGNLPPPPVIYAQPVLIAPAPIAVYQRPVYLYVPPGHQKHWDKHCARYAACGQPVYFVRESWVRERYDERLSERHEEGDGKKPKKDKKHKNKHDDD